VRVWRDAVFVSGSFESTGTQDVRAVLRP